jgi:hypothetical protein
LAMFNLAIDSKLRGCDFVELKISDVMHGHHAAYCVSPGTPMKTPWVCQPPISLRRC